MAKTLVDPGKEEVPLRLLNVTKETIHIRKGTVVAELVPISDVKEVVRYNVVQTSTDGEETNQENDDQHQLPAHLEEIWQSSMIELDEEQRGELKKLLNKHSELFSKSKEDLGLTDLVEHHINTGDARPIRQRARRLPLQQREEEKRQIEKMVEQGIVDESQDPWSSPVVLVRKKDNTWRFSIDYRAVNACTAKDAYPLPRIDDSIDHLSGARWFSTLDLQSGYWQVKMAPEDQEKTVFIISHGLFEFKVMPFGLANAPATFERLIERILRGM